MGSIIRRRRSAKTELVRALFDAVNEGDDTRIDELVARSFQSYGVRGTRSRTGLKRYYAGLRGSFADLHFEVHENIGVLVEHDLVALRTIITGRHAGDYAGVAPTGKADSDLDLALLPRPRRPLAEHWQVADTYRILAAIGAIPGVASVFQEQVLHVEPSPDGLFPETARNRVRLAAGRRSLAKSRGALCAASTTGSSAPDAQRTSTCSTRATSRTPAGRPTPRGGDQRSGDQPRSDARRRRLPDAHWSPRTTRSPREASGTERSPRPAKP